MAHKGMALLSAVHHECPAATTRTVWPGLLSVQHPLTASGAHYADERGHVQQEEKVMVQTLKLPPCFSLCD